MPKPISSPRCYTAIQDLPVVTLRKTFAAAASASPPRLSGRLPQALGGRSLGSSARAKEPELAAPWGWNCTRPSRVSLAPASSPEQKPRKRARRGRGGVRQRALCALGLVASSRRPKRPNASRRRRHMERLERRRRSEAPCTGSTTSR